MFLTHIFLFVMCSGDEICPLVFELHTAPSGAKIGVVLRVHKHESGFGIKLIKIETYK